MRTGSNSSRTDVWIFRDINASPTLYRNAETKSLSINLYHEEVKAFTSRTKVVWSFGFIALGILGMKQAVKYPFLIILSNSNSRILDLEK
jgi:hypothetical protein